MKQPYTSDLIGNPFIQELAKVLEDHPQVASQIGRPTGGQRAKIVDVNDPLERGRVRVIFDALNKEDIPAQERAGGEFQERQGQSQVSHWVDCCPSFKGKQPPGLIGKRVLVNTTDGELHYAILGDVLNDPELLVPEAASRLQSPNNSSMTRLPVYPADQLPPPVKENVGCIVIEESGPMNSDWLCVCLKRDGKYIWVRHSDLAHGHAGGNDITSQVDSSGNRPGNGQVAAVWDYCFPTSQQTMVKRSQFGTDFRGNPFGGACLWHSPPNGVDGDGNRIEPIPIEPAQLFDQANALSFIRETGFPEGGIPGDFTSSFDPGIPAGVSSIPGYNQAGELIKRGQTVAKVAQSVGRVLQNPSQYVIDAALAAGTNYITKATEAAVKSGGLTGLTQTVFTSLTSALASITKPT